MKCVNLDLLLVSLLRAMAFVPLQKQTVVMVVLMSWLFGTSPFPQVQAGDGNPKIDEPIHVYLLIGQSNMAGRAPMGKEDTAIIERCFLLNNHDQWEPAKNPLNLHSTIRKRIDMQKTGPGSSFAQAMLENDSSISIGFVVNAKGGTRIEQWGQGTDFYNEAVRRTKEAQKTGVLKGVLWHQGEGNSKSSKSYLEKLGDLIGSLRKDLGQSSLPFVAGQVFYDIKKKPNTKKINNEIAKLPQTIAHTGVASSEGLTTLDNTHFDQQGIRSLGQRYAEEMLRLQAK